MSAPTSKSAIELPQQPKEKAFEEYIAGILQCSGLYIERNIVERDIKEVLELDIISTDYNVSPPDTRLVEIKSGGWGFPEIFKVYGWLKYLDLERGVFIVKEDKDAFPFYQEKAQGIGIDVIRADCSSGSIEALGAFVKGNPVVEIDHELWRFSYWLERNLLRRLLQNKKSQPNVERFSAMDSYFFNVNSGVFFTEGAVHRAQKLYETFQENPRLSAMCASEEVSGVFDCSAATIPSDKFRESFYECKYTDLQISTYIEHRSRLAILKNAIDHILYSKAGKLNKAGAKTVKMFGLHFANAPQTFLDGMEKLSSHKYLHRYPVFWQWFMWFFGGFILKDFEEQEYQALASRTGIPVDEVGNAFDAYGTLFPVDGGWFRDEPYSNVRVMRLFPVPFMGIGACFRKHLYTASGDYDELKVSGRHTKNDLIKWNNLAYEVIAKYQ